METQKLPRWKSHKEVEAFKIVSISFYDSGILAGKPLNPDKELAARLTGDGLFVDVSWSYNDKHKPKVGGYYVRYADGYESFSPAEAFEEGYEPMVRGSEIPAQYGRCASGLSMLYPGKIMVIPPPPETAFIKWATELYQLWYRLHGIEQMAPEVKP